MNRLFLFLLFSLSVLAIDVNAQTQPSTKQPTQIKTATATIGKPSNNGFDIKRTSVYAELLVRKIEAEADLQVLLPDYTEESSEVRETRLRIKVLERAIRTLEGMSGDLLLKLSPTVGRLLARKLEAEAELKVLTETYTDEYPAVKKAKIRYAVFESELKKIF